MLEHRMEGSRPRGRPRIGMLDGLLDGEAYSVMKRREMDRGKCRGWLPRICH